jgi:signal transduction histidine kinase
LIAGEVVLMLVPPVGIAPIFAEHKCWGVIVFQSGAENVTWPIDVKGVFEVAAGHLGTYFEHHQAAAERARFIDALDASENAIVVTDDSPEARILHANRAFRTLAPQVEKQSHALETALQYPVSRLAEDLNTSPSGRTVFFESLDRWFQVTRSPIDSSDRVKLFVWVFTDVTERKRAERMFFTGLLKEQELSDRKTRLITNVSHQFFTPLSVILSSAELIQRLGDRCTPEKRSQLLSRITQTVEQMTAMMHSQLELEQKPLGEREAFSDSVDLGRTLIGVIDDLCLEDKRWTGIVPRILGRQRRVRTSERLVRRAMVELLRNAGAYGGEFIGFQVNLDMDQDDIVFSVRDRGPGLPVTSGNGAQGLGLAIVRECCQQLSGAFEIANHPAGGVLATIRIPDAIRSSKKEAVRA